MKKTLFLVWLLCVTATYAALAGPPPTFSHLPDYMVKDHCEPFSRDAVYRLHANGIPAHRILFGWQQFGGNRGWHAAVLFKWEGKFYFMDNARMKPREVPGNTTDLGVVQRISGSFGTHIWMTDFEGNRVAPRKMQDLFAPPPDWMKHLKSGRTVK